MQIFDRVSTDIALSVSAINDVKLNQWVVGAFLGFIESSDMPTFSVFTGANFDDCFVWTAEIGS